MAEAQAERRKAEAETRYLYTWYPESADGRREKADAVNGSMTDPERDMYVDFGRGPEGLGTPAVDAAFFHLAMCEAGKSAVLFERPHHGYNHERAGEPDDGAPNLPRITGLALRVQTADEYAYRTGTAWDEPEPRGRDLAEIKSLEIGYYTAGGADGAGGAPEEPPRASDDPSAYTWVHADWAWGGGSGRDTGWPMEDLLKGPHASGGEPAVDELVELLTDACFTSDEPDRTDREEDRVKFQREHRAFLRSELLEPAEAVRLNLLEIVEENLHRLPLAEGAVHRVPVTIGPNGVEVGETRTA